MVSYMLIRSDIIFFVTIFCFVESIKIVYTRCIRSRTKECAHIFPTKREGILHYAALGDEPRESVQPYFCDIDDNFRIFDCLEPGILYSIKVVDISVLTLVVGYA